MAFLSTYLIILFTSAERKYCPQTGHSVGHSIGQSTGGERGDTLDTRPRATQTIARERISLRNKCARTVAHTLR